MRIATVLIATLIATAAFAKLPPPTDDEKAKAAESAAKSAWSDKVGLYQLCLSQDRTVAAYRNSAAAAGQSIAVPVATAACSDPGAYVPPVAAKPLEAAGAHSPPAMATSPPNSKATSAEISGTPKK
jgi:hypothetical protein